MGRYWNAFKAGLKGFKETSEPGEYQLAGRPVRCPHCGHQRFVSGHALLNTAGRTFFNMDYLDPSATTLVCAECGRIEWFAEEPERTQA
jgi:DNA-directed RNA polymerase subunit RPC12/RpoP